MVPGAEPPQQPKGLDGGVHVGDPPRLGESCVNSMDGSPLPALLSNHFLPLID